MYQYRHASAAFGHFQYSPSRNFRKAETASSDCSAPNTLLSLVKAVPSCSLAHSIMGLYSCADYLLRQLSMYTIYCCIKQNHDVKIITSGSSQQRQNIVQVIKSLLITADKALHSFELHQPELREDTLS